MPKKPIPIASADELAALGVETIPPAVEEIELVGEGTDRAFRTVDGRRFRVRVRLQDRRGLRPGHAAAAPTEFTLAISVAELDDDSAVKQAAGGFLIHDVHELLIGQEALANPLFDPGAAIRRAIEAEIERAASVAAGREAAAKALLEQWGIGLGEQAVPTNELSRRN